ncbi:MAG: GIY-YIG nuclease family protein [Candidatus Paceibacterota bacterium]
MSSLSIKKQISQLPTGPGIYLFFNTKEEILYIGKAINIRKRIQSHFAPKNSIRPISAKLYPQVRRIDYIETKNEKDALLLEQRLVKLNQPKYNIELKDDKNYSFVAITHEELPRVFVAHQTKLIDADLIGPFISGKELRSFLAKIRILFPYRTCKNKKNDPCLDYHLGLCPAHGTMIKKYSLFLEGLIALLHLYNAEQPLLECYDISHTSGSYTSGSLVTFRGSKKYTKGYRLFNVRSQTKGDDPRALREVLERRLAHTEWQHPDLILIDGGKSQLSQLKHISLPIIGIAKYNREAQHATLYSPYSNRSISLSSLPEDISQTFLRMRDEAHRFAIRQQRKRQAKI